MENGSQPQDDARQGRPQGFQTVTSTVIDFSFNAFLRFLEILGRRELKINQKIFHPLWK